MATMDIFEGDAFSIIELTRALENIPFKPAILSGAALFGSRGVQMTEAGEKLQEQADYLLKFAANLQNEVKHLGCEPAGMLVVGLPPSLAYILTPGLIRECKEKYPLVSIKVIEALSVFQVEWLEIGKIDIAVLTILTDSHMIQKSELCQEPMVLVGTPDNIPEGVTEISMTDLNDFNIIITGGFLSVLQPWFKLAGYEPHFEMELDSIAILRELVRKGLSCSIVPYSMVHEEVEAGILRAIPLTDPEVCRTIVLALNTRGPISLTMSSVGNVIAEQVKHIPKQG